MMQKTNAKTGPAGATTRFLCVELESEQYAIPILSIYEIQAYAPPTPVPRMPSHVRGVSNLHGEIVPVVDLRLRFGMSAQPYGPLTVIVYVGVGTQIVGLIVDLASRVIDIDPAQIKPPPNLADIDLSFVAGIVKSSERAVVMLNVEALLRGDAALAASVRPQSERALLKED